jgi:hypothetical protein
MAPEEIQEFLQTLGPPAPESHVTTRRKTLRCDSLSTITFLGKLRKRKMEGGPQVRIIGSPDFAAVSLDD